MAAIYHLLDESEAFSDPNSGAISRWAASVLRDGEEVVVCPKFDMSWGFPIERIYQLPNWSLTSRIHPILYRLPWFLQKLIYMRIFQPLFKKLKKGDVLYTHNRPESAAVLAYAARKYGFRVVLHMHNSHLTRASRGQLSALKDATVVFCSEFLRKEVNAKFPGHFTDTHIVYNGADGSKFHFVERDTEKIPTVIFTGRLVKYKGVHVLLEAMRILEEKGVQVNCKIVGASGFGNSRTTGYVRKLLRMKPANTDLVGYKSGPALAELLKTSDIFCCPSIWNDPFPLAPLEAMATGLPVVASSAGGLPETLLYGGGLLVAPGDPFELAATLEKLVTDVPLRKKIGVEAENAFRNHYLWSNVREQYEHAIQGLFGRPPDTWHKTPELTIEYGASGGA